MEDKKAVAKEIFEWFYCILIAIALALLIRYFVGTPTVVQQTSMFPTLKQEERLILNRLPRTFHMTFERGDIITFEAPRKQMASSEKAVYEELDLNIFEKFAYYVLEINKTSFIKRVVGLEGERIEIKDGKVYVNGEELKEDYLAKGVVTEARNEKLTDFIVPEGYVFAIGDNREGSMDCRTFGCIPVDKIEGKVLIRFWPLDKFGKVE